MNELIGIDHIYINVSDLTQSESFYDTVFIDILGFRKNTFTLGADAHIQYYNRHFGYVLRPTRNPTEHDAYACGLHHLCFRVKSIEEVKNIAQQLQAKNLTSNSPEHRPEYAPDYWAIYFDDPDGIRLEITNYRQERRERHDQWEML